MGISDLSPQLLLGGAGAVIGFGTSWGLSRFGLRPTLGQAAWFANATAWGTLAGQLAWSASGSNSAKLEYGSLVLGEAVGMGLGVLGARRWKWTPGQVVLADSLLIGAGLTGIGVDRLRDQIRRPAWPRPSRRRSSWSRRRWSRTRSIRRATICAS